MASGKSSRGYGLLGSQSNAPKSRWALFAIFGVVGIGLILLTQLSSRISQTISLSTRSGSTRGQFHLFVPATSSNKHLCRCILSAEALNYPSPILINWGNHEDKDPYVQHLGKVDGILKYLDNQQAAGMGPDDLVLIVDGFDLWFQLPPEVLIGRYFKVINEHNARLEARFGRKGMEELGVYSSVLFASDKIYWPEDPSSPGNWAVPDSWVDEYTFGPDTDLHQFREYNKPRWLNSGTIIGPIKDIRVFLEATAKKIQEDNARFRSDQHYMALVWADQEYARTLQADGPLDSLKMESFVVQGFFGEYSRENINLTLPDIRPGQVTEYHLAIDYDSALFQTMSRYWHWFGWQTYDGENFKRGLISEDIQKDILASRPPFGGAAIQGQVIEPVKSGLTIPTEPRTWRDMPLGVNTATRQIFPILHFTPPKNLIDIWWPRMWFFPYAESIIRQAGKLAKGNYGKVEGDAHVWWPYDGVNRQQGAGAFDQKDNWLTWQSLCGEYEAEVFENIEVKREKNPY